MSYDTGTKLLVWFKAARVAWLPEENLRRDRNGNLMRWEDYGDRTSACGWEIHHIIPVSRGGSDDISNLEPLQWNLNAILGDRYPSGPSLPSWGQPGPPWEGGWW
jgi:5-methylcytosine-specific restriction endonuclease McrA